jgi:glycosyltransferase involved in cell wall biosynthesis
MHVVQIAPPWYPVPPAGYGGIERVVHDLTEGLVAAGHHVTLVAPAGSRTSARLIETMATPVGLDLTDEEKTDHFIANGRRAYQIAASLGADVVHDHTDFSPDPGFPLPIVRTPHGPAVEYHVAMYEAMSRRGDFFVAISHRQRELFEAAAAEQFGGGRIAFAGVVHNPIDVAATPFYPAPEKEDYVAFLGRCHWEKDPAAAIRVAVAAGVRLKMALRITTQERPYYEAVVRPAVERANGLVEFLGEVGGRAKSELIGRARAVVFPSPWEEPFGLVLTEAAAHGTPVVALRRGASPEIVADGVTGILCGDEAEMAAALPRAMALDPAACRAHVAARFDRRVIAERQAAVYDRVLAAVGRSEEAVAAD